MNTLTVAENFDKYFAIQLADTDELRREAYRIRHSVYCEELGWEPKTESGLESDECDHYSFSLLLVHKRTGHFSGTARLVIPPPESPQSKMPFELHCMDNLRKNVIDPTILPRGTVGEVSRLAVPAEFRRRHGERNEPFIVDKLVEKKNVFSEEERRHFPNIAIGLYLSVIAMVSNCNHTGMFVVVEPRLKKRLERLGLMFQQAGDDMEYHGKRALFYLPKSKFTAELNPEMLELYQLLEEQLLAQLTLYPYKTIEAR